MMNMEEKKREEIRTVCVCGIMVASGVGSVNAPKKTHPPPPDTNRN